MKNYTGRGDDGTTSLYNGKRCGKDDPRVIILGEIDMLQAQIGALYEDRGRGDFYFDLLFNLAIAMPLGFIFSAVIPAFIIAFALAVRGKTRIKPRHDLKYIMRTLYRIMSEVGECHSAEFDLAAEVAKLEMMIDKATELLPPIREFILPIGDSAAAKAHICRCQCRRVETQLLRLDNSNIFVPYFNRLSSYFFEYSRC